MSSHLTQLRSRSRRLASALAGLAVGAAAVLLPTGAAEAGPVGLPPMPDHAAKLAVPHNKIPAGAVRATHGYFKAGAHGATFQAAPKGSTRVIGGTLANVANYPGIVGVQSLFLGADEAGNIDWYIATCTGTVISSTKVLTAGHCSVGWPWGATMVIAGRNDINLNVGGYVAYVATTWTHQGFNLAALYDETAEVPVDDVSVLTLKEPLPAVYTPVKLSAQGDETVYAAGTEATIAGYGVTSSTSGSGVLHEAKVPIKSAADCATIYGALLDSTRMVCAGDTVKKIDSCHGDSGGPIYVNGVQVGITDWGDAECSTYYGVYEKLSYYASSINEDLGRSGLINLDWTGDGHSDLFGRFPDGYLWLGSGSGLASDGYGGFSYGDLAGSGWNAYNKIFRVYNWLGDKNPAVMARDTTGKLFLYPSDGLGNFVGQRIQIGSGWNTFTDIMVTNNWNGDGRPNLMGRTSTGDLIIYTSDGQGGWTNPHGTKIGTGWNAFNTVLTPGSWLGDGRQSLIGRTSDGKLLLYTSDGHGGWADLHGTQIGTGWNTFKVFLSPGDWNGDNMIDLIGITPTGLMRLYTTNGKGAWLDSKGKQIAEGWDAVNMVF